MRKLVAVPVVAWVLAAAAPAAAIQDPSVPAPDCAAESSQAVGHPAVEVLQGTPAGAPNPGNSEAGLEHNEAAPRCANL